MAGAGSTSSRRRCGACCRPASSIGKKQGFGVPLGVWFRGGLTDVFSDVLASPRTRQRGYFEPAFVDRLLHEHLAGKRDHTLRLWQLLVFELWHRQYLDAPVSSAVSGCRSVTPGAGGCRARPHLSTTATHVAVGLCPRLSK